MPTTDSRQQRTCWWCQDGSNPLTREHVIGQWLPRRGAPAPCPHRARLHSSRADLGQQRGGLQGEGGLQALQQRVDVSTRSCRQGDAPAFLASQTWPSAELQERAHSRQMGHEDSADVPRRRTCRRASFPDWLLCPVRARRWRPTIHPSLDRKRPREWRLVHLVLRRDPDLATADTACERALGDRHRRVPHHVGRGRGSAQHFVAGRPRQRLDPYRAVRPSTRLASLVRVSRRAVLVDAGAPCAVRTTARRRVAVVVPCPRYGESSTSPARVDAARAQAALRKPRADRKDAGPARVSARGSHSVRAVRTERECGSSPERSYRLMGERADRPHL